MGVISTVIDFGHNKYSGMPECCEIEKKKDLLEKC